MDEKIPDFLKPPTVPSFMKSVPIDELITEIEKQSKPIDISEPSPIGPGPFEDIGVEEMESEKKSPRGKPFSTHLDAEMKQYIATNYMNMSDAEMASVLGIPKKSIEFYRAKNNLVKKGMPVSENPYSGEHTQIEVKTALTFVEELEKYRYEIKEDVLEMIPAGQKDEMLLEDFTSRFVMIRPGFSEDEWSIFVNTWKHYAKAHSNDFNLAEDFDDMCGLVREIIMQNQMFKMQQKSRNSKVFQDYQKQYTESYKRMQGFQNNLRFSRKNRKQENSYDEQSLSDIVALFDKESQRKIIEHADKEDNVELLGFVDKIKRRMAAEGGMNGEVDGQESGLMYGPDEESIRGILDRSYNILKADDSEIERGEVY